MKVYDDIIQFIDYILNCISNGKYLYYQLSYIPEDKRNKEFLAKLDNKIREKYQTDKNKNQRLYLRRQDKARFLAARYKNILLIMKTEGDSERGNKEKWEDIRKHKIEIRISKDTAYLIGVSTPKKQKQGSKTFDSKVTVTLHPDTLNLIKMSCLDEIRVKKSISKLWFEWNKINGFNGWAGINKQKIQLRDYLVIEVCKHFGKKKKDAQKIFRINTYRAKSTKEHISKDLDTACENQATDITPVAPEEL